MARRFDIVLFGASGFTGRLVADYLRRFAPTGTRIALAGRNQAKLAGLGFDFPLLVADSGDPASLKALAEQTRVVCTTVGPYAKYGLPLVEACAKAGTHYCDLTGETQFMRSSIDAWHETAKQSGARIVHTCGFDSIPSDIGVQALHEVLGPMKRATYAVMTLKGGFSGGTIDSLMTGIEQGEGNRDLRRMMADPYSLSPDRSKEPDLGKQSDIFSFHFDDFVGRWVAPFVMASVNTRVVRRSNALLDYAWGRQLRYSEVSAMKSAAQAAILTGGLGAFMASLIFKPTRALVAKALPKPGEGPSEETREKGRLKVHLFGESEKGERKTLEITGEGDPGYKLTSLILGQAALCLALDEAKLPKAAGVLTPATAMGRVLRERLVAAGMTFQVKD